MELRDFFRAQPKVALAFSGGVDSAYLLYEAKMAGCDVTAYYVKSAFQPQFEYEDVLRLAKELSANMRVLPVDILACEAVTQNPANRCYYCKKQIFEAILRAAKEDGYTIILDGTNASDDASDRPGMKALTELSVLSPLRECGLTKQEIRKNSKEAGLFTHDKPAYACLATRVKTGEKITAEVLSNIEEAESYLMSLGLSDFRVRVSGGSARIEVKEEQLEKAFLMRSKICTKFASFFEHISLDLKAR